jgi:hypothetical protein
MIIELAIVTGWRPAELQALDDVSLATLVDVLAERANGKRRG